MLKVLASGAVGLAAAACSPAAAPAPTNAPAASAKPYAGKTVRFLCPDMVYYQLLEKRFPQFTDKTGIKIEMEKIAVPLFVQRGDMELSSKSGTYNAMHTMFIQIGRWLGAGWTTPLDDFINNAQLTDQKNVDVADYLPTAINIMKHGGKIQSLPFMVDWGLIIYRKDILDKAGVTPPDTYDDLVAAVKEVHTNEVAGFMARGQPTASQIMNPFPSFLQSYGADIFANPPTDMTPAFNNENGWKAADVFCGLMRDYAPQGAISYQDNDAITAMQQGKAAMWIDAISLFSNVLDKAKSTVADKVNFCLVPKGAAGRFPIVGTHGIHIPADAQDKEAAWQFIQWATGKETMAEISFNENYPIAPRKSIVQDPKYKEKYSTSWNGFDVGKSMVDSLTVSTKMAYRTVSEFTPVGDRIGNALQQIITNQMSTKDAFAAAEADVRKTLEKAGYKLK